VGLDSLTVAPRKERLAQLWDRYAPLSGLLWGIEFMVAILLASFYGAGSNGSLDWRQRAGSLPSDIASDFDHDAFQQFAGGQHFAWSIFLFLWFLAILVTRLRAAEGEPGVLSLMAFGAGVVACATLVAAGAAAAAGTHNPNATKPPGIDPAAAEALVYMRETLLNWSGIAFATLLAAVAVISIRTRALPLWLGLVTAGLAVGLMVPPDRTIPLLLLPFWAAATSITLFRQQPVAVRDRASATARGA
jgi:hypothetical protein